MTKHIAILDATGRPMRRIELHPGMTGPGRLARLGARYDAAQTTTSNSRHWFNADAMSADAAMSPSVRRTLVHRSRYEIANNSYAKGIVLTKANDTIGRGPRLQMQLPKSCGLNRATRKRISRIIGDAFFDWSEAVRLARKLRTMDMARTGDGEAFASLSTNPAVESPVQLDLKPFEGDRVASPHAAAITSDEVDGVIFDDWDNPVGYRVAKQHPGGQTPPWNPADYRVMPAREVIHWFRQDRAEAHRAVPEITPALPLFALLRSFTLAVMDAARNAATFSGVLHTNASPDPDDEEDFALAAMTSWPLERDMWMALPDGYDINQFKPEQPAATYKEFKAEILNEIARCLNIPYNVAAGNSSGYNYASGRLDHQGYFKDIDVIRGDCETVVLGRLFREWLLEACDYLSDLKPYADVLKRYWRWHQWFWDGREHVDPLKVANAATTLKEAGLQSDTEFHAARGVYIEDFYDMLQEEAEMRAERGLPEPGRTPAKPDPADDAGETPEEMRQRLLDEGEDPDDVDEKVEQMEEAS